MEGYKICFKCGRELPLAHFYTHKKMADGHLNKCKDCTKKDARNHHLDKSKDPLWVEKERARGREKSKRLDYAHRPNIRKEMKELAFPHLREAKRQYGGVVPQGYVLHHWNYATNRDLFMIDRRLHSRLHTRIVFSLSGGIYSYQGEILDTAEKHLKAIKLVCDEFGFDYSLVKHISF